MNKYTEKRLREILSKIEVKERGHSISFTGFHYNYNEYFLTLLHGSEDEKFLLHFIKGD